MQITNNLNQQNFNGAFRIKPSDIKSQLEIPNLFTQGRQIFGDILEKGDMVIVLRDNYDKRIAKYICANNLKDIEYYPEINTKSGLDSEISEGLLKLINNGTTKVLTDINEICKRCFAHPKAKRYSKKPTVSKEIEKISNALRLNIEKPIVSTNSTSTIIRDENKKRTIEVIMQNKGNSYVYVRPDIPYMDSIRCILDGKGSIMKRFETPNEMLNFNKRFRKLKEEKVNILTKN